MSEVFRVRVNQIVTVDGQCFTEGQEVTPKALLEKWQRDRLCLPAEYPDIITADHVEMIFPESEKVSPKQKPAKALPAEAKE